MAKSGGARNRILDSFVEILIADGARSATLDAVAHKAEVSKGGLLYHFPSRAALAEGLIDRLRSEAQADVEKMLQQPDASEYYIRTSLYESSALDLSIAAVLRLESEFLPRVHAVLAELKDAWYAPILAEVGDPAVARAILLLGDGLYFNHSFFGADSVDQAQVEQILQIVSELRKPR